MRRILLTVMWVCLAHVELRAQGAALFHVFPQLADGVLADGSFYVSTLLVTNTTSQSASCTVRLYGNAASRLFGSPTFTLASAGTFSLQATVAAFGNLLPLATGYATVTCNQAVTANLGYLFFSKSGAIIGGATVFSSPPTNHAQLLVNQTGGTRLAIALANDTDAGTYQVTMTSPTGQAAGAATVMVAARSNSAKFLDELMTVPDGFIGAVSITSSTSAFSVIGLFYFNGPVFTTQPATLFGS